MVNKNPFFLLLDRFAASCGPALVVVILLGICALPVQAGDPPAPFTLEVHDSQVNIAAENAPLQDILKAISQKSGLTLRLADQADELISCHLTSVPLAESLEKILGNWNYALLYKKDGQGRSVPDTLWVIKRNPQRMTVTLTGDKNTGNQKRLTSIDHNVSPTSGGLKKFKKEDVSAVFSDSEKILIDVEAEPLVEGEHSTGIEVTRLADTSPLKLIGLEQGDQIININGQPLGSTEELVRALAAPVAGDAATIRIERYRDGRIDPIYLQLQ